MILQDLKGMTLGSDDVEGDGLILLAASLVDGDSCTWVTPTMGTWGGATIINDVVADGVVAEQNNLEDKGLHNGWYLVAIISTSKILAAGVPNNTTSNCCITSMCRSSAKLCIWLARQIFCNA